MKERYLKWWTPALSREIEMLVFGDGRGLPLILFPTSFGRYTQNTIGSTIGNGAATIGITGATCCRIICPRCNGGRRTQC